MSQRSWQEYTEVTVLPNNSTNTVFQYGDSVSLRQCKPKLTIHFQSLACYFKIYRVKTKTRKGSGECIVENNVATWQENGLDKPSVPFPTLTSMITENSAPVLSWGLLISLFGDIKRQKIFLHPSSDLLCRGLYHLLLYPLCHKNLAICVCTGNLIQIRGYFPVLHFFV